MALAILFRASLKIKSVFPVALGSVTPEYEFEEPFVWIVAELADAVNPIIAFAEAATALEVTLPTNALFVKSVVPSVVFQLNEKWYLCVADSPAISNHIVLTIFQLLLLAAFLAAIRTLVEPVSYTHLTLPTKA